MCVFSFCVLFMCCSENRPGSYDAMLPVSLAFTTVDVLINRVELTGLCFALKHLGSLFCFVFSCSYNTLTLMKEQRNKVSRLFGVVFSCCPIQQCSAQPWCLFTCCVSFAILIWRHQVTGILTILMFFFFFRGSICCNSNSCSHASKTRYVLSSQHNCALYSENKNIIF